MAEVDWKMEAVMQYLKSPAYTYPVMNFIDENCAVFDQEDESKHEFNAIHQNFVQLVFGLLEAFLAEIGVTSEDFATACSSAVQAGGDRAFVFQQIMAVDDFQTFRRMMMKRNFEIEMDALKQMEMLQQKAANKAAKDAGAEPPPPPPPEDTPGNDDLGDLDVEEQRQLEEALALSRMTFDSPQQTAQMDEDSELEVAIAMSKESAKEDASRTQKLADFVPDKALSEEEMMAKAIAASLTQAPPEEARQPATIPQTMVAAPPAPPTPPPEEVEAVQALPAVTKDQVEAAERKHELAVAEHALALSAAIAKQAQDEEDHHFALEQSKPAPIPAPPAPADPAPTPAPPAPAPAPPPAAAASASSLPPVSSPSASASSSSLPPLKPMGNSSKGLDLAGLGAEEMHRIERRAEKAKRDKDQELLAKKISALKEQPGGGAPDMSPADLAARDTYLKAQRQRLVEAKKKEREEGLKSFSANAAVLEKKGSLHAKVASEVLAAVAAAEKSLTGAGARPPAPAAAGEEQSEEERKRQEMRKALAKRLKDEVTG